MYNLICSPKSQVKAWPYLQIDCFYSWIASESGIWTMIQRLKKEQSSQKM